MNTSISTLVLILSTLFMLSCNAQLSPSFYDSSCPNALTVVRTTIRQAVSRDRRTAGVLLRLHFHDCFAQGCDASILLDDAPAIQSEKTALPNRSVRGYDVVEAAKSAVERMCPGVVSCSDVLTLAARDTSVAVGGPSWSVKLGRRDSTTTSFSQASTDLPSPFVGLNELIAAFDKKKLTARDMVALSGSHTIGQSQCQFFRRRIYGNGTDIDAGFASIRRRTCPSSGGDGNMAALDLVTPNSFDNNYFKNLMQRKGLLHTDQVLFGSGGETDGIVSEYSRNPQAFMSDFAAAIVKMGEIDVVTGQNGIIRRICSAVN